MGHALPANEATPSARAIGIRSNPLTPPPLLMKTCTIGTVKISAIEAAAVVFKDLDQAFLYDEALMLCRTKVINETAMNMVPGRNNG